MSDAGNNSEVARLLRQIDLEFEAAQRGLTGLSMGTARHDFIHARLELMNCSWLHMLARTRRTGCYVSIM